MAESADALVHDLLRRHARATPDAASLVAADGRTLPFARLAARLDEIGSELARLGFGRGDRLALMLPDGPEFALVFLAIAGQATAAPLNPAQAPETLAGYVADTGAKAILASAPCWAAARDVAGRLGLSLIELAPETGEVASFALRGEPVGPPREVAAPSPEDVAYLLPTAGTTGRPKVVPVRHSMVMASCRVMRDWLELSPDDRCLDVMPLFHSHGILNGVIWPLSAGGSTVCPPKFDPRLFFDWFAATRPSWYTAVPAIHQAVVSHAAAHADKLAGGRLRFVRSSSAALSAALLAELDALFGVPVIETYGLTETGPLVTSPLAPGRQKPGKAGRPSGPEVRVTDQAGAPLPAGRSGEIVARGPTIMAGYERNDAANADAFRDGWFRTGDLGWFDEDGYLTVSGRLKEQINRGGEKIAPLDVDNALLSHPAVREAACFAVPHPTLGEDIAAAAVLRPGMEAAPEALRAHVLARLDAHRTPRLIRIVDALPRSAAGKIERGKIAAMLGLDKPAGEPNPATRHFGRTPLEAALLGLWQAALRRIDIGPDDDFFLLGGDSLSAVSLVAAVNEALGVDLTPEAPFENAGTLAAMLATVEAARRAPASGRGAEPAATPDEPAPATPTQRAMWVVATTFRGEPVFNVSSVARARGPLDLAALERAAAALSRRHDALRTVLRRQGGGLVNVVTDAVLQPEPPEDTPPGEAEERAARAAQRAFDLSDGPPARLSVLRLGPIEHELVLTLHHTIADGWSKDVLLRDLARLYAAEATGRPHDLPPPPSFSAFARRQAALIENGSLVEQARAVAAQIGPWVPTEIATRETRPDEATWPGFRLRRDIGADIVAGLRETARGRRGTLFMGLLAAFGAMLTRQLDTDALALALPGANRAFPGANDAVGCYSNAIPLRLALPRDAGFADALDVTREATVAAFARQHVPFDLVLAETPRRKGFGLGHTTPILFQLQNYRPFGSVEAGGVLIEPRPFDSGIAQADLSVEIGQRDDTLVCEFSVRRSALDRAAAANMIDRYAALLSRFARDPGARAGDA
ncbi:AMP-binding protein [Alsobacter sp. SYSU M60028]|uniref:AMP-binding protein n=1 Tax=Alsobacter ponti TaxID=2962936 RepID=A0ABT1LL92_9HYPH|nr:AMP-binding protein [Alsobacter ponti]